MLGGNRLDVENRRLREEDAELSVHFDLEVELEQSRVEVARLTECVKTYELQLSVRVKTEVEDCSTQR